MTDPNIIADLCTDFPVQYTKVVNAAQDLATLLGRRFRLDLQYTSAGIIGGAPSLLVEVILDPPLTSHRTFPPTTNDPISFGAPSLGDVHRQIAECIRDYLDRSIPQVAERAMVLTSLQRQYPPSRV